MDDRDRALIAEARAAERQLVVALRAGLERYDQEAARFGVALPEGSDDGCACPPCEFLRACRAIVGAWEDRHGPLVR